MWGCSCLINRRMHKLDKTIFLRYDKKKKKSESHTLFVHVTYMWTVHKKGVTFKRIKGKHSQVILDQPLLLLLYACWFERVSLLGSVTVISYWQSEKKGGRGQQGDVHPCDTSHDWETLPLLSANFPTEFPAVRVVCVDRSCHRCGMLRLLLCFFVTSVGGNTIQQLDNQAGDRQAAGESQHGIVSVCLEVSGLLSCSWRRQTQRRFWEVAT